MTNLPDNPERDSRLSAAWREHSSELPPSQLDAAILAAAHRAVASKPADSAPAGVASTARETGAPARAATGPQRWWMPLAAAATIGAIALGVLQTAPQNTSITSQSATDMPSSGARDATPAAPSPQTAAVSSPQTAAAPVVAIESASKVAPAVVPEPGRQKIAATDRNDTVREERDASASRERAPPPTAHASIAAAPEPFPAEKKNEATDAIATQAPRAAEAMTEQSPRAPAATPAPARMAAASDGARQRSDVAQAAPAASGTVVLAKSRASVESGAMKSIDIDATIVRIRKLHDEGKLADAAKELNSLRATIADADSRLPPELRAWAATVKP